MTTKTNRDLLGRGSFWTAVAFYVLIGFEFLYMATPFAAFFYSVYRPGLNFFGGMPLFEWLTRFFMPHIVVQTSSALINAREMVSTVLIISGLGVFFVGAGQVYYHKFAKKGAVTGGLYRFIRHPQYAAFMLCGFGLLVLWPRYVVLVMFVTMLFGYYWLARVEERECERKYGLSYQKYKERTAMFMPFPSSLKGLFRSPGSGWKRKAAAMTLYAVVLACGITGARMLESHSLHSLYVHRTADSLTISAVRVSPGLLGTVVATALADERVQKRLERAGQGAHFLNYVLPAEWFVSEVPMNIPAGICDAQPAGYDRRLFKIVFTRADVKSGDRQDVVEFVRGVKKRTALGEAWVDITGPRVVRIIDPPGEGRYESIPMALY